MSELAEQLRAGGSVFAEEEAAVLVACATSPDELNRMVRDRLAGTPLEYVVGWADFLGLRVIVEPGVFVPRKRTEHLVDLSPNAQRNLVGTPAVVHHGGLYDALPRDLLGRIDLVVANAPYVPTADLPFLPREAHQHEDRVALDGGPTGLDVHRRIILSAREWLAPEGMW